MDERRVDAGGIRIGGYLWDVDVDAVAEGEDGTALGLGCDYQSLCKVSGQAAREGEWVGQPGGRGLVNPEVGRCAVVAGGDGDGGDVALDGGVGRAEGAGEGEDKGAEVGAIVGAGDEEVGDGEGGVERQDVV